MNKPILVLSWYFARVYLSLFSLAGLRLTAVVFSNGEVEGNALGRMVMILGVILTAPSLCAAFMLWGKSAHRSTFYLTSVALALHAICFLILGFVAALGFFGFALMSFLFFQFTFGSASRALCGFNLPPSPSASEETNTQNEGTKRTDNNSSGEICWYHVVIAVVVPFVGLPWGIIDLARKHRSSGLLMTFVSSLLLVIGASRVLHRQNQESSTAPEEQISRKLLRNDQVDNLAVIHIKGDTDLTLARKADGWHVQQQGGSPADITKIRELLIKMGDLKVVQFHAVAASHLALMHLAEPGNGSDSAVLLEFKDAQNKILQSLLLGRKHYREKGFADGRYITLRSDPNNILLISDALEIVDPNPNKWLDKGNDNVEKP